MIIFAAAPQSLNSGQLLHKNTSNFDWDRNIFYSVIVLGYDLANQAENYIIDSLYSSYVINLA